MRRKHKSFFKTKPDKNSIKKREGEQGNYTLISLMDLGTEILEEMLAN